LTHLNRTVYANYYGRPNHYNIKMCQYSVVQYGPLSENIKFWSMSVFSRRSEEQYGH
jgi:uncharacterized membrane protein